MRLVELSHRRLEVPDFVCRRKRPCLGHVLERLEAELGLMEGLGLAAGAGLMAGTGLVAVCWWQTGGSNPSDLFPGSMCLLGQ